uniref:Fibronectin type-II domain-containing protein n=1 Tax=Astyanax mexicanus TaxID=7994 RepID=A0A3B1IX13_ASTMX
MLCFFIDNITTKGDQCVFPFFNNGVSYTDCVNVQNSSKPWCSTTDNYTRDGQRGDCLDYGTGNSNGSRCVFPFFYNGNNYTKCIGFTESSPWRWCSTTNNYTRDGKWGECPDYVYIPVPAGCLISPHTDQLGQIGLCAPAWGGPTTPPPPHATVPSPKLPATRVEDTVKGNSNGAQCIFPFFYNGNNYTDCIKFTKSNTMDTTDNYTRDGKWGECTDYDTVNGNSRGSQCVFPFFYNGNNHTDCISFTKSTPWSSTDHQYLSTYKRWCSTTDNYTRDGKWGECTDYGTSLNIFQSEPSGHTRTCLRTGLVTLTSGL